MYTKEQKLALIDLMVANIGLTRDEVVECFTKQSPNKKEFQSKINITEIKPGMFWYEDDTFSFEKSENKRIKAIVELVENTVIYGDLTASEIYRIPEVSRSWCNSITYINNFPYRRNWNEKIVMYNKYQFEEILKEYKAVQKSFKLIGKPYRKDAYWIPEEFNVWSGMIFGFDDECDPSHYPWTVASRKENRHGIRPVIALQVD